MITAHKALIILVYFKIGIELHELSGIRDDSNMNKNTIALIWLRLLDDCIVERNYCLFMRNYGASMSKRDAAGMMLVPKADSQAEAKSLSAFVGWLVIPCYIESRTTKSLVFHTTVLHSLSRWTRDSSSASSSFHPFLSVLTPSPLRML